MKQLKQKARAIAQLRVHATFKLTLEVCVLVFLTLSSAIAIAIRISLP